VPKASDESATPKETAVTPSAPADKPKTTTKAPADPLAKFKTELPNGLTVHNYV